MTRLRHLAALCVTVALAAPGAALAQSAGDQQYQDPFPTDAPNGPDSPGQSPGGTGGGGGTSQGGSGGGAPAPSPGGEAPTGAVPAPAASAAADPDTASAVPAGALDELPRTGGPPAGLVAALGASLALSGAAFRRAL